VLLATIISFFVAEIGDKTQIATAVIAAQYQPLWQVVAGTTTGMLIADIPAVWLGAKFAQNLPLRATRMVTALLFAALGGWILLT
jgi:putative Ca2+/H+ antiporter (TMEM165/GDT1 family)